ncbi:MAG: SDR family oxidoreductase [Bacteroidales bacterium]|nr:SDR family oxidoreductase [Bacteroidales bacterium]
MKGEVNHLFCSELPTKPRPEKGKVLVTGASGYIGGRLVPELIARGYDIRVMVRASSPEYAQMWPGVEVVVADIIYKSSLRRALKDVHTAYYLVHSLLLGKKKFESADIEAAINFREIADECGVKRIIYLGGLGDFNSKLSPHLRSRKQVGRELMKSNAQTIMLRAAIIIGSGSASYEIIKHLIKNTFLLIIPPWARTRCQPIAIRDVIKYLVGIMETEEVNAKYYDIGGADVLTYEQMLKIQAELVGKRRLFIRFPFNIHRIYTYFVSLLTPVPAPITRSLLGGHKSEVICRNHNIRDLIPFEPVSYKEALLRALSREEQDRVYTRWSDAYPPAHELSLKLNEINSEPDYTSVYSMLSDKPASSLFTTFCMVGGKDGWFHNNWLWRLRGVFDRLLLGVGMSRGRKSESRLQTNDVIGFWRVEDLIKDKKLLLRAEMKLPGKAWLEFEIDESYLQNKLTVRAYYYTKSIWGKLYWYSFLPFHAVIFQNLIEQIDSRS